ncbi:DUF1553 domain-containing protein [Tuwongella immobilis]|uniref:Cytochrome c domain-containing protein n=1 Tax=Tuwongella immobilis TaxID=692036 RepID=A0A6C2YNE3_9BACT|nr:DUF1553 domain-containing protein [Tuwongella immobilis]VIP02412.1 Uncharacterized protein OS=Singulisphaera acidiphila (strain ATCC BAA-1392 / DSM 18658 / VKM B-2454 / MOB10) GN=Sinac_6964 PE=4 SV=1: PSCyt1: PSCyt2: PSD1 [Tuwongella immobilis]VTS01321.1 Uncharacterized protein OS=Singulisphaera acidiphila (strain ATCC BAA-1392 / DSM 18658 / VKM B-2454 / MOB10) GN=Sinac_6964 PE=4 SV=1: PSCyt1: PSCyt2: PSD1 [Tuwongella immobilis]
MRSHAILGLALPILLGATPGAMAADKAAKPAAPTPVVFERDVRPILKAMCFHCHGEEPKPKGELDLRLVRLMHQGGESGPAIVPGKPDESPLWERVASDEMPEGSKKLTAAQKATLRAWIEQGAKTARPEPTDPALARFTEEERTFWAFQPVRPQVVPTIPNASPDRPIRTPIDAFLAAKLAQFGHGFAPEADRVTLIRRLTYDLIGLPPTPEEVQAFVTDAAPNAYEKVVDRLLASPHYGERWARHWLDVAGYAESEGGVGLDRLRPVAYKYRDYVIRSFNADKPYDQFVREQLAGDELNPTPNLTDPKTIDQLTATGFLRMAPDLTEGSNVLADRNQAVAESLKVVGTAILGLTVGCAQCHDHRYDPISIDDYYRFRAIFDPMYNLKTWKKPSQRLLDVTTKEARAKAAEIEAVASQRTKAIYDKVMARAKEIQQAELAKLEAVERKRVEDALALEAAKRSKEQVALLEKYPNIKEVTTVGNALELYDPKTHQQLEKERAEVAKLRETKPPTEYVMIPAEAGQPIPESAVMFRGDPEQPKAKVAPGELEVLAQHAAGWTLPAKSPNLPTSGRRLAYAQYLTNGKHPLTARVMVNRIWMHHFGKGIVATPNEFGMNGDRPSHPELLDWLADDFVRNGWQIKRLHRLMVTSTAYRQVATRTPELDAIDPDNRLVGRMSVRRLDAESVRDSLLATTGKLDRTMFGKSMPVTEDLDGRGVFGIREVNIFGKPYGPMTKVPEAETWRRSIYVQASRSMVLSMLDTFDLPVMSPNCDQRRTTNVPPQSLLMLNDADVVKASEWLGERVTKEHPGKLDLQIDRLAKLLFGAAPTAEESQLYRSFVEQQTAYFSANGTPQWLAKVKKSPAVARNRALALLAQTLISSNRFLYVD